MFEAVCMNMGKLVGSSILVFSFYVLYFIGDCIFTYDDIRKGIIENV